MTVEEVRRTMTGYTEGTGWDDPGRPREELHIQGALVFRHSNEPEFNSDWGIVWIANGRVTKVEFSPD